MSEKETIEIVTYKRPHEAPVIWVSHGLSPATSDVDAGEAYVLAGHTRTQVTDAFATDTVGAGDTVSDPIEYVPKALQDITQTALSNASRICDEQRSLLQEILVIVRSESALSFARMRTIDAMLTAAGVTLPEKRGGR